LTFDDEVVIEREIALRDFLELEMANHDFLELEIANHDFLIRHDLS